MNRQEAINYLLSSGFSEEQINTIEQAFKQEPKAGHWIVHPEGIYAHLVCNKCLSRAPYDCKTNYCPNCGAKMVEPQESEVEDGNNTK